MLHHETIGYVLGALESAEMADVERFLQEHPHTLPHLETIRRTLASLSCCCGEVGVPAGLAFRTCQAIRATHTMPPGDV